MGLNPALQRTLVLPGVLSVGGVHRATSSDARAGGKGQGAAAAIAALEPAARPVVVQLLGRDRTGAGERVEAALRAAGVETLSGWYEGTTRTCVTVASEPGLTTEVIEPSAHVPPAVADALLERTLQLLPAHGALVLAGTAPPGAESFYARLLAQVDLAAKCRGAAPLVVLDSSQGVGGLLATGRVDVLKVNRDELLALAGEREDGAGAVDRAARLVLRGLAGGAGAAGAGAAIGGLGQARREAHARAGSAPAADGSDGGVLAVTDGGSSAALFTMDAAGALRKWALSVPRVEAVNAIGAGDVCTGIFAHKLACAGFSGQASASTGAAGLCDAFSWGLAAASARCASLRPDELRVESVYRLRARVHASEERVAPARAEAPRAEPEG